MTDQDNAGVLPAQPKVNRNVWVLAAAAALAGSVPPIVFATVPLAAYDMLGMDKTFATLPITCFVVGTACGTVPAALLMRWLGRRGGAIVGMLVGATGSVFDALAVWIGSFPILSAGAFLVGFGAAFVQQFRFAAVDATSEAGRPRAISIVMAGGIVAAVLGPQAVIHTADRVAAAPFAGAYLCGALLSVAAALVLLFLDIPRPPLRAAGSKGRSVAEIAIRPEFLVAVGCATMAYALMSFVMTAAPLAMVLHHHSRDSAVLAIQWHVLAMYCPSFFTGRLIERFGAERIVAIGLVLLMACAGVALTGTAVGHFWLALVLLGIGWNFGFIGGTALVTQTYRPEEKEKVQALNDFLIFGVVAIASFSSGETLLLGGWNVVNIIVLPFAGAALGALAWRSLGLTSTRP